MNLLSIAMVSHGCNPKKIMPKKIKNKSIIAVTKTKPL